MSNAKIGKMFGINNPMFGTETTSKKIEQLLKDGIFIKEWNSILSASKELKIHFSNISRVCNGKRKRAGGYIWKFI